MPHSCTRTSSALAGVHYITNCVCFSRLVIIIILEFITPAKIVHCKYCFLKYKGNENIQAKVVKHQAKLCENYIENSYLKYMDPYHMNPPIRSSKVYLLHNKAFLIPSRDVQNLVNQQNPNKNKNLVHKNKPNQIQYSIFSLVSVFRSVLQNRTDTIIFKFFINN